MHMQTWRTSDVAIDVQEGGEALQKRMNNASHDGQSRI
jgi:hypothetical protein